MAPWTSYKSSVRWSPTAWSGGQTQAMAWYRSQPIAALDGRTAEALVKTGKAGAVRDYLDHLALGGFA